MLTECWMAGNEVNNVLVTLKIQSMIRRLMIIVTQHSVAVFHAYTG